MQLKGLKVHFQEDAELMRGAGPWVPPDCYSSREGAGLCPELHPHPPKSWVSRAKSAPRSLGGLLGGDAFQKSCCFLGSVLWKFLLLRGLWEELGLPAMYFCEGLGSSRTEPGERRAPAL